jgi:hypothetical protein
MIQLNSSISQFTGVSIKYLAITSNSSLFDVRINHQYCEILKPGNNLSQQKQH